MGFIFLMLRECSFLLHCLSGLMETQSLHFAKIIFLFLLFSFSTLAWKHWRPPAESVHAWEAEVSAVYPVQWIPTPVGTTQYPVSVYPVGRTNPETSPGRAVLVAPPTPHLTPLWVIWRYFKSFFPLSLNHVLYRLVSLLKSVGIRLLNKDLCHRHSYLGSGGSYCYLSPWGPWRCAQNEHYPCHCPWQRGKYYYVTLLCIFTSTLLHYISFEINTDTQRTIQRSSSWAIN